MNEELKTHKFLKQKKIEKLDIATQEVFENFVDDVLILDITNERIKRAPNILYIGNLNEELANTLGLSNVKVYMRKNELYHARKERKEKFVQDVPTENFKNLPNGYLFLWIDKFHLMEGVKNGLRISKPLKS